MRPRDPLWRCLPTVWGGRRWPRPLICAGLVTLLAGTGFGCAGTGRGTGETVAFRAPSAPDPELAGLLQDVESIGVLSTTNIEPVQGLDIEKVMGRLTDATARGLENLPGRTVVTQDDIRWHFRDQVVLDSASVFGDSLQQALREEMAIDALVFVALRSLNTQMTSVSPGPYGSVPSPGVNVSVELQLQLVNLHTGERWSREGRRSSWQPMQVDVLGGGRDRTEQQLLTSLARPLRQFLARVAPPPRRQMRQFDTGGD